MKLLLLLFIFFINTVFAVSKNKIEVLGYVYRTDSISHLTSDIIFRQNKSLRDHIQQLNIVAPQAYQVNDRGFVWGKIDPALLKLAQRHPVKIMPLITDADFNKKTVDIFLHRPAAQAKAIRAMVRICEKKQLAGFQIDFEHVPEIDRHFFTVFFQNASAALHQQHFLISVAIIPRTSNRIPRSTRERSAYEYWNGAYDYRALGQMSDFVTLMAYDQHSGGTTPGAACQPAWLKKIIVYALRYIPAKKISVGLPVHSSYWYTATGNRDLYVGETDLTYTQAQYLLQHYHAHLIWSKKLDVPYAIFTKNNLDRFLFVQNAATFKTQIALVERYHLRGVSLWCLGYEDPMIWKII